MRDCVCGDKCVKQMMEDENDPIVCERTVMLSRKLHDHLLLLQYPVRSAERTYDKAHVLATRVKPGQQSVELELGLDSKSCHYSVTGAKDTGCMDRQILTSSPSGSEISRYAVGVLRNNELHLTPLRSIVQMRPNYTYVDSQAAKLAAEMSANAAADSSEGEDDTRPVTVRFKPHESEDALARRMASYEYHQQQADEEAWVPVRHFPVGSEESEMERWQLFADHTDASSGSEFYIFSPADYQKQLISKTETEVSTSVSPLPNSVLSLAALKTMTFADRIRALMHSVRAIRFTELLAVLKSLIEPSSSLDGLEVLRHLQQYAVLIQGCWVVKSDVLYVRESASELTGTPSDVLCRARDFVLWRFEQGHSISRKEIATATVRLPTEDEREILDKIARRSATGRGWEFRMERDAEFLSDERYRQVIKRQENLWQQWRLQMSKLESKQATVAGTVSPKQKHVRSKSRSSGERCLSDQSDTDMDTSVRNDQNEAATTTPMLVDVAVRSEAAEQASTADIEDSGMARTSCSDVVRSALEEFARDRLNMRTVLTVASLRTQLDIFLASAPSGHPLGAGGPSTTPLMLEQSLIDAGAIRINVSSSGRTPDSAVYVLGQRGNSLDAVRSEVIDMLQSRPSMKIGTLRKRLEQKAAADSDAIMPTDGELRSVLKEYCITRGASWALKESTYTSSDS